MLRGPCGIEQVSKIATLKQNRIDVAINLVNYGHCSDIATVTQLLVEADPALPPALQAMGQR
ncbi:hypothetical protein CHELA40_30252 [Chelatococcus asaccharovorans]|nr:hypothetical protein CHELA17_40162 [Chelatococcus asaccharovorans]CAH1688555.1 hypothetical protein CHELA40_30252 [Chelatococcus asaccharovorans]